MAKSRPATPTAPALPLEYTLAEGRFKVAHANTTAAVNLYCDTHWWSQEARAWLFVGQVIMTKRGEVTHVQCHLYREVTAVVGLLEGLRELLRQYQGWEEAPLQARPSPAPDPRIKIAAYDPDDYPTGGPGFCITLPASPVVPPLRSRRIAPFNATGGIGCGSTSATCFGRMTITIASSTNAWIAGACAR